MLVVNRPKEAVRCYERLLEAIQKLGYLVYLT
jgi:hypothetical protein